MCYSKTMLTSKLTYEVVSKIFWTDVVKIVKLTAVNLEVVPSRRQTPSFLERFLEVLFYKSVKHSMRFGLYLLNGIKPASFQLQFHFWKKGEVTGC